MVLWSHAPDLRAPMVMSQQDPPRFLRLLEMRADAAVSDERYFHWDQLRHRTPPEGLSHEEWWMVLKLKRLGQKREVPLQQKNGTPFWFAMTDEVLRLSEEVARRTGGAVADASSATVSRNRVRYVVRSLTEEAITSSQLEGASTSRRVALELLDSRRSPQNRSEVMILNNYMGMEWAKENSSSALTLQKVLELHRILTEDTLDDPEDAGRLDREDQERVGVWAGEIEVHSPPSASELSHRLEELCRFANGTAQDAPYIPAVVRAIIVHFMFGYDHYFADGNGRTARAAFYWSMLHSGLWLAEYLAISKILRKAPGQYGDSYQHTEDDEGDLTYFIRYQLDVILRSLDELNEYLETKRNEEAQVRASLQGRAKDFNHRQLLMLETLVRGSALLLSVQEVSQRYGVSAQTARNDLALLEEAGFLYRGKSKRPVTWFPPEDLSARISEGG